MSDAEEWNCEYGDYFVELKDHTPQDWTLVVKHPGRDNFVTTLLAGDHDDAKIEVDKRMLRDYGATRTSVWKERHIG